MAIKTKYDLQGLEIKGAYIRVENISGNKNGWDSLVSVNNIVTETIENKEVEVKKQITTFNHSCEFKQDERGYTTLYKSLQEKFGGTEI